MVYCNFKTHEPTIVANFRMVLKLYIEKIRNGNLTLDTIDSLISAFDELKQHKNCEKFKIEFSTEEFDVFIGRIYDYTIHFAENNHVELTEQESIKTDSSIINFQNYLKIQKRIFKEAA